MPQENKTKEEKHIGESWIYLDVSHSSWLRAEKYKSASFSCANISQRLFVTKELNMHLSLDLFNHPLIS